MTISKLIRPILRCGHQIYASFYKNIVFHLTQHNEHYFFFCCFQSKLGESSVVISSVNNYIQHYSVCFFCAFPIQWFFSFWKCLVRSKMLEIKSHVIICTPNRFRYFSSYLLEDEPSLMDLSTGNRSGNMRLIKFNEFSPKYHTLLGVPELFWNEVNAHYKNYHTFPLMPKMWKRTMLSEK